MDRRTYRERHPGARLFSFKQVAADTGRDLLELMTEFSEAYATPEERADATANGQEYYRRKDITTYTICCVDRCGFKAAELGRHLRNVHRISTREYWAKYGFLPTTTEASLARAREKDALRKKELEQLRAAAKGRPKAKRGRRQVPIENREYARVGAQVDKLIPNHLRHDKRAIQAARWEYYNNQTDLEYDTIAEYDRRYRQRQREKAQ
jgi:predicted transcriptional regulator